MTTTELPPVAPVVSEHVLAVCRDISDQATEMMVKARWSARHAGDQIMVGRRGCAEGIVAERLSIFASSVAGGADPEVAFQVACDAFRAGVEKMNQGTDWASERDPSFGLDTLRAAFWRLRDAVEGKTATLPTSPPVAGGYDFLVRERDMARERAEAVERKLLDLCVAWQSVATDRSETAWAHGSLIVARLLDVPVADLLDACPCSAQATESAANP